MTASCHKCQKVESPEFSLKRCAKCNTTLYCGRDCQKADWKAHKKVCGKQAGEASGSRGNGTSSSSGSGLSPPKGLDKPIVNTFTRLDNNTWLHDRPETDVYRLLLDAYRLRAEDEHNLEGKADADGLYGGASDSLRPFQRFLRRAASRPDLLPPWWNEEKKLACERFGMDQDQWQNLRSGIEKSDIIEHYGDAKFPMQLRFLGEAIIGKGPGGQDGTMMRKMMVMQEGGSMEGMTTSMFSV
ncbi:Fc.00g071460.m01.CDS01 [Cosmosporella sp. VM-42]